MGKISPIAAKYIIHASIQIDGVVERPDVIGAIFGQTEGLLGSDLELRELQRSGRIGRIEVNVDTRAGKTYGSIVIPSSLDKAETAIVAAALEVIQRIGPCNAKIKVTEIEDVRVSKRKYVIERAKELLKQLTEKVLPDSQELTDEVTLAVRAMEIQQYGKDRLAAGPAIDESDEIIVVEGRADVLNLLKHGIKNAIAMNGTSCPETIIDLSKKKIVTLFVDGDRGGDLIIKEVTSVADVDFVARAPDGKEVEELTKKEIHKALRNKVTLEQAKHELPKENHRVHQHQQMQRYRHKPTEEELATFKDYLEDLIGTRGAYLLDRKLNILAKVPASELGPTIRTMNSPIYAIVVDAIVDHTIAELAARNKVQFVVGMGAKVKSGKTTILTVQDLA